MAKITKINKIDSAQIREAIRGQVIDPEMGVNVVDMGLIYDIQIEKKEVRIKMTLTSMGCPSGPEIMEQVRDVSVALSKMPTVVELVWEPAWNKDMLSEDARNEIMLNFL